MYKWNQLGSICTILELKTCKGLNYHLAGDPLELPQGPLGVPKPHFENQCIIAQRYHMNRADQFN